MSENTTNNSLINAELPPSVDNAVKNLTDKPTEAAGTTFADIWYLIFHKFSFLAEKKRTEEEYALKQYRDQLDSSIASIPTDKLIAPSLQVTAQALDNSKYCISEAELRNMFVSLISNSMNVDFSGFIHPSFSEMIKQMSPLDAKIIALFKNASIPALPVCQYHLPIPGSISGATSPEHIFMEIPDGDIFSLSMSLVSLSRLGLINISYLKHLHDQTQYEKFLTHPFYKGLSAHWPVGNISIQKGVAEITPLGRSFVKVCVPD